MPGVHLEKRKVISDAHFALCIGESQRMESSAERAGVSLRGGTTAAVTELSFVVIVVVKILASTYSNPMSTAEIESTDQLHERSS